MILRLILEECLNSFQKECGVYYGKMRKENPAVWVSQNGIVKNVLIMLSHIPEKRSRTHSSIILGQFQKNSLSDSIEILLLNLDGFLDLLLKDYNMSFKLQCEHNIRNAHPLLK